MNSIAVLLNNSGEMTSWLDNGIVKLYKKTNNEWIELKSLPYTISTNLSIIDLRNNLLALVEKLLLGCYFSNKIHLKVNSSQSESTDKSSLIQLIYAKLFEFAPLNVSELVLEYLNLWIVPDFN